MGEFPKKVPDLVRAMQIAGSFMEKVALATTLVKVPGTIEIPCIVAAATRMGGTLDDCFDRTDRRVAQAAVINGEAHIKPITTAGLWHDYTNSWRTLTFEINNSDLESVQAKRTIQNSVTFFRNIRGIEMAALANPIEAWTIQQAIDYRKAICLMWAEYFASLSPKTSLAMGINTNGNPPQVLKDHQEVLTAHKPVADLYFGSVAYQMVGDWAYRFHHQASFIPGLGSLGSEKIADQEAKAIISDQIQLARQNGSMNFIEELSCKFGLPFIFKLVKAQSPVH